MTTEREKLNLLAQRRECRQATLLERRYIDPSNRLSTYSFAENRPAGLSWLVSIAPLPLLLTSPIPRAHLEIDESMLARAQNLDMALSSHLNDSHRRETIDFLTANWHQVVNLFYPGLVYSEKPQCFSYVDLGQIDPLLNQQLDFAGFGPDGTLFVLEIGKLLSGPHTPPAEN